MGKFLLGVATGLVLVFLTIVLLIFAALRFREKPPSIAANSVLLLRLQGEIPEKPPVELPALFGGDGPRLTLSGVWTTLKKAAADSNIKAIVLEPEGLAGGWGKLEEIRSDLEQFRKSGKPVYAYLRTAGGREYYVASTRWA
jgi:protease-4